jgi:hypothetical protein
MTYVPASSRLADYELKFQFVKNYLNNNSADSFIDFSKFARTLPDNLPYSVWLQKVETYLSNN